MGDRSLKEHYYSSAEFGNAAVVGVFTSTYDTSGTASCSTAVSVDDNIRTTPHTASRSTFSPVLYPTAYQEVLD